MEIGEIISRYTEEGIAECRPIGGGHINETFYVRGEKGEYLLQKLNGSLFGSSTGQLEHNYLAYVRACEKLKSAIGEWEWPRWLKSREDAFFVPDDTGVWRMYGYIRGDTPKAPLSREQIRACGQGLAVLHTILSQTGELRPVLPYLHDTRAYYKEYLAVKDMAEDSLRDPEAEELIARRAEAVWKAVLPGNSVIHGDTRVGNMIFRNGRVLAMIDLDTLMYGPRILDLADCIRSCCMREGRPDEERIKDLLDAYEDTVSPAFSAEERELLPAALERICFELGLRYYTDHLKGNIYFTQDKPGRNLERAGMLLRSCGRKP